MQNKEQRERSINPYSAPQPPSAHSDPQPVAMANYVEEEFAPFKSIWTRPRETIDQILAKNPSLYVIPLACLAGIAVNIGYTAGSGVSETLLVVAAFVTACFLGPIVGLLVIWIGSALVELTGKLLEGTARGKEIRLAIAWSTIPLILASPFWVARLFLSVARSFVSVDLESILSSVAKVLGLVEWILVIWTCVLACKMVAEVQGYQSAWRGFGNLFLATFVAFVSYAGIVIAMIYLVARLPF